MDIKRNITRFSRRLYQSERGIVLPSEKFRRKKNFLTILIAVLVLGLILAFLFAQMPIAGETFPIPGYP